MTDPDLIQPRPSWGRGWRLTALITAGAVAVSAAAFGGITVQRNRRIDAAHADW